MFDQLCLFAHNVLDWPFWDQFQLIRAQNQIAGNIFSFAEFLATLALLLVIMIASDFRFRYRLSLTKIDLLKVGFWVGFGIGAAILAIDLWFLNGLPVPKLFANSNNLKGVLGFAFLAFVFRVVYIAAIRPPVFSKANAMQFYGANYHFIHEGNADRLQIIAEEMRWSLETIVATAAKMPKPIDEQDEAITPIEQSCANNLLLLIGDGRFCRAIVDKVPAFSFVCFEEVQKYPTSELPVYQFARNIGQEFVRNTSSSFYQEDSGFYSGLFGYTRPATNIIFGNYKFIERCAADGASPLDTDYREFSDFNETRMEGFSRASLAFLENYLKETDGKHHPHSYALTRLLSSFESALTGTYRMNGVEDFSNMPEYGRLTVTIDFIKSAIALVDMHATHPRSFRVSDIASDDIYDKFARLIFETIFAASSVTSPVWTAWSIQHNAVWSPIFSFNNTESDKIISLKVRRLIYEEIKRMDDFANFKGARILGYCLNIFGLTLGDRHQGHRKEFYPLRFAALGWTKANYRRLLADHPKVAAACLHGSVSWDATSGRLVKTYASDTAKEPSREYMAVD